MNRIVEFLAGILAKLTHPSTFLGWIVSLAALVVVGFILLGLFWEIKFGITSSEKWEEFQNRRNTSRYYGFLKQYYYQYGNYLLKNNNLIREIECRSGCSIPEYDIQVYLKSLGDGKTTAKKGIWLIIQSSDLTLPNEIKVSDIQINGNRISCLEEFELFYSYLMEDDKEVEKRWLYCLDIFHRQIDKTENTIIWKDCICYNVSRNTVLEIFVNAMRDYYRICYNILEHVFTSVERQKETCIKIENQLNAI